ncbi:MULTISPECIES: cob(I)yrinic acid a,c-diamide adenosyltransferase [unclassified Achromobacter]|uniref:cob(I)yrinic acid a,c-diamide adenosyltransferase n=1 Tax=unclassified Achromobacter TaxID=2626865 RepID=UPI000B51A1CF|nr:MULTISPECIES: cob(I)yrinic acid a,c-diamide adenosyltransferase [unclassified Achromobacter]OWT74923.1 ATP:cob(I)alamin adenosyltransferase [Achromobacter sp. HZ28]OWT76531.1 ATP:cob(I)alamin adenosyltransferase [Achromobacter sp. HZ34]
MANRLSVIATRTGDDGTTGLGDGTRVSKDDLRIAAMGDVDELNSTLGLVLAELTADEAETETKSTDTCNAETASAPADGAQAASAHTGNDVPSNHQDQAHTLAKDLRRVQHCLFDLGAELSIPGYVAVKEEHARDLDDCLKHYNATLTPLQEFILPGGTRTASLLHVARTVCRRAERAVVALGRVQTVHPPVRQYLNRLSDLLFVAARHVNKEAGTGDILWKSPNSRAGA